jgi:DNA-binding winged helix-turn-helix (wHTH) protein
LRLAGFVLDLGAGELRTSDHQVAGLRKQALDVLLVLGARAGQVVSKDELMRSVWRDVVVGEGSLAQAISDVRRVLRDDDHRLVRNVARRGYMLMPDPAPAGLSCSEADAIRLQRRLGLMHLPSTALLRPRRRRYRGADCRQRLLCYFSSLRRWAE